MLPSISIALKRSQGQFSFGTKMKKQFTSGQRKGSQLVRHISDPFYMRLEKTNCPRTIKKHSKFENGWSKANDRRRGKSLMQRSFNKATYNLSVLNEDSEKRRKFPSFQQILRNNIAEKTFIHPAIPNPEIKGLQGRGGKMVPLF